MNKILLLALMVALMQSCVSPSKLYYFHNQKQDTVSIDQQNRILKIKENDRLIINVSVADPAASAILNPFSNSNNQVGGGSNSNIQSRGGYLVDIDGNINFPTIGKVEVKGLTIPEAEKVLTKKLEYLYKDPYVNINIEGRAFFMSEKGGTTIPLYNQRLTVFEALAQSGVVDPYDIKDKLWLVREENDERTMVQLNLNDKGIFDSPYYYLHNNDLLYIKPGRFFGSFGANSPARFVATISTLAFSILLLIRSLK